MSIILGKNFEPSTSILPIKTTAIAIDIDIGKIAISSVFVPATAMDCNMAKADTATISSTIKTPSINIDVLSFIFPNSSNTLIVTTVLVIDMANPKNIESKVVNPNLWATKKVIIRVPIDYVNPTIIEILTICLSFAIGNSIPITKRSIIIPNSANMLTVSI